ncbi:MAG: PDZ domain-containing protein [Planctomycetota bacterium]|nr:MAG: PDZ domain-containing protein [Planctomycetota bacterium]REJ96680.1 MAG: PDZ domain-containing protein [Planctomycetota bacterium]REK22281.1 MAG: PDZ domain-containing protein [Planctomycetota bacterium]REK41089.1 MAG: PDZ domain-containing protein [Planctomycetota bacterium]
MLKRIRTNRLVFQALLAAACLGGVAPAVGQEDQQLPTPPEAEQIPTPNLWIGVMCHPLDEALRAHLSVPADKGLHVADVVPTGPAAAAGVLRHDILLTADGKDLATPDDLVAAVAASRGEAVEVVLLRAGRETTLNVTPVERPNRQVRPVLIAPEDQDQLENWFKGLRHPQGEEDQAAAPRQPLRLRFFNPDGAAERPQLQLPDNMSISIIREGGAPVRLRVRHGTDEWELGGGEVEEGKVATLPDRIRPHVRGMLDRFLGGDFQLPFMNPQAGGDAAADDLDTDELVPDIEIPGADDLSDGEATTNSELPEDLDTDANAAQAPRRRLPAATDRDAALEEINQAIRDLNEQLKELRRQRREIRAGRWRDREEPREAEPTDGRI